MEVEMKPPKKIVIYGVEKRKLENLVWCAVTYGVNRLFWIDGHLLCLEVYEKSFEHEIIHGTFPISQLCYAKLAEYTRMYEVEKGVQIPIVDVSDTRLYRLLLEKTLKDKAENDPEENCEEASNRNEKNSDNFKQFIS